MSSPVRFSVIIPAYQQARYLADSLDCVLGQSHPAHEVIIVNDGSTDATPEICADYARRSDKVRYISKGSNRGVSAARNTALQWAKGDFIQFLDADDYLPRETLELHAQTIEAVPGGTVYYGSAYFMNSEAQALGEPIDYGVPNDPFHALLLGNQFPPHTAVVRREAVFEVGGWDVSMTHYEDWDLWLRLALLGPYVKSPGVCVGYRQHGMSATRNLDRMRRGAMAVLAKAERYHRDCPECRRGIATGRRNMRSHFLKELKKGLAAGIRNGRGTEELSLLAHSVQSDPALLGLWPWEVLRSLRAAVRAR